MTAQVMSMHADLHMPSARPTPINNPLLNGVYSTKLSVKQPNLPTMAASPGSQAIESRRPTVLFGQPVKSAVQLSMPNNGHSVHNFEASHSMHPAIQSFAGTQQLAQQQAQMTHAQILAQQQAYANVDPNLVALQQQQHQQQYQQQQQMQQLQAQQLQAPQQQMSVTPAIHGASDACSTSCSSSDVRDTFLNSIVLPIEGLFGANVNEQLTMLRINPDDAQELAQKVARIKATSNRSKRNQTLLWGWIWYYRYRNGHCGPRLFEKLEPSIIEANENLMRMGINARFAWDVGLLKAYF